LLEDLAARQTMAESLISTQKGGPSLDRTDMRLLFDKAYLAKNIQGMNDFLEEFIPERWGIVCLSAVDVVALLGQSQRNLP
jgi:hypothetical protein